MSDTNHSLATLAESLKGNSSLSDTIKQNLSALADTLHTTKDDKAKITTETFHQNDAPVTSDAQALDLIKFAGDRYNPVVTPVITEDMDSSQRIMAQVEATEQTERNQAMKDSLGFIGCTSYNADGSCSSTAKSGGII